MRTPAVPGLIALCSLLGCAHPPAAEPARSPADRPVARTVATVPQPPRSLTMRPPETSVEAIATSFAGSYTAWFESFRGTAHGSVDTPETSRLELHLDMTTLTMATAGFTRAVRSPTFFDVERYPRCDFVSTSITPAADKAAGAYHVTGTLDLHGVSRPVSFDVVVVRGDGFTTLRTELAFPRHDFGLVFGGPYEKLADEAITVRIWAQDVASPPEVVVGAR
jgi:polyisoprenoid-binding protein YceI